MPVFKEYDGVNNVDAAEDLSIGELRQALNVDIDNKKKIRRRGGYTQKYAGTDCHSLWGDTDKAYFVEGNALKSFDSVTNTAQTIKTGIQRFNKMAFMEKLGDVYFCNGVDKGIITPTGVTSWGVELPARIPDVLIEPGAILPGTYMLTLTYIRDDGTESGAIEAYKFSSANNFSLSLSNIPQPTEADVAKVRFYLTQANGETFYKADEILVGITNRVINAVPGAVPLRSYMVCPPPAGTLIEHYNGRMLVVDGKFIYFSESFAYEWFRLHKHYWRFSKDVTMCGAVEDGVFIAADKIYFLSYNTPTEANLVEKADYGAIKGTMVKVDAHKIDPELDGEAVLFMSKRGVCIGTNGGGFRNLTYEKYEKALSEDEGTGLFREFDGVSQYLSLAKKSSGSGGSRLYASDSAVAEVVRNGVVIN